jgi:hypothetical protein
MVAQAYANEPATATPPGAPTPSVAATTMTLPADTGPTTTQKVLRGGAIVLGVGGVVAIALGGWKASQNGDVSCAPVCMQRDTTAGMATAFAVGGVAIAAAIPMAIVGFRHRGAGGK